METIHETAERLKPCPFCGGEALERALIISFEEADNKDERCLYCKHHTKRGIGSVIKCNSDARRNMSCWEFDEAEFGEADEK